MFNFFNRKKKDKAYIREYTEMAKELPKYDLLQPLVFLSEYDALTIGDFCQGVAVFGATGSGKTSGSGKCFAKSFLNAGFGGLVLTAKPDDCQTWLQYCHETNRSDSVIVISAESGFRFNFLNYELNRPGGGGGLTENISNLFTTVLEIAERKRGASKQDYWNRTLKQLLRNTIDLITLATDSISVMDMYQVITTAPYSPEDVFNDEWRNNSKCFEFIQKGLKRNLSESRQMDYELTVQYWLNEFPSLADRTRSIIVSSFTSLADTLLRGITRDILCTETNFLPELAHEGAVIILDFPIKKYGEVGLYIQVLFKYIFQQSVERRTVNDNTRPVFLWADEAQFFMTSYDQSFQTTARSSRACSVYMTQNLPNYYAALGGEKSKSEVDSFLGNLQTKTFHSNGDTITNKWASELFAQNFKERITHSTSSNDNSGQNQRGISHSQSLENEVQPHEFTTLRKGGFSNDLCVDAIIFQGGRIWNATGKNHLKTTFNQ